MLKSKLKNMPICFLYIEFSVPSWQIKNFVSVFGINDHINKFFDSPTELSVNWHAERNNKRNEDRKIRKIWKKKCKQRKNSLKCLISHKDNNSFVTLVLKQLHLTWTIFF